MAETIDILFVIPGDHRQTYQSLGDEFSAVEPPAFAGLFATYLLRKGCSVAICDAPALALSAEEAAVIACENFDAALTVIPVYGNQPSASTQTMTAAGSIARLIKENEPGARVLMTGTHPAALPKRTMIEEAVDFVCDREGPVTIHKTFQALKGGTEDFSDIPSLWWRDGERIVSPKSAETLITDLDNEMPGIAWDLLPMDRYRAHNWHCIDHISERQPYASIHTSLGCPYSCGFCCINAPFGKPAYRMWSPQTVVDEIDLIVEKYGVTNIKFVDEMFVFNKNHVLGICDLLIERGHKLNIWAYARVDTVQEYFLEKLKVAGFNWLCLGIESGSEHVRDGAKKAFGNDEIIDVVRRIQNAGIYVHSNFIFGLPDDTPERMQNTLDLALELNCEFANFYSVMAYPGSPLHATAVEQGLDLPNSWKDYSQHGYGTKPLANEHCGSAEILEFRDKAFTRYFTHKPYLEMIATKFGPEVVDHINRMLSITLPRKLLEEQAAR